jgi:hypothetical protein
VTTIRMISPTAIPTIFCLMDCLNIDEPDESATRQTSP